MSDSIPLGVGNLRADIGDHIAYFWETEEEFRRGAGVLLYGLQHGDKCVVFGHDEANQRLLQILHTEGFDVEDLRARDQLSVIRGQQSWKAMLDEITDVFSRAKAEGYSCIRLLGNIGWEMAGWPAHDEIVAFEAHVTNAAKQFPCVIVCMYAINKIPARALYRGGFQRHPRIATPTRVVENFYNVETGELREQLTETITNE